MAFPNLSIYSAAQLQTLKDAVIAERLRRVQGGSITQGNKNGRGYSVEVMSEGELSRLEDELARRLGTQGANKRRINFNNGVAGY